MLTPKEFDDSMREAAHVAEQATKAAMRQMAKGNVTDEDDVTGVLVGQLNAALDGRIGALDWNAKILRHRKGKAAEEQAIGADILLQIRTLGQGRDMSKGVLIQSKRVEKGRLLPKSELKRLQHQCETMLKHTPASFVFDYASGGLRCSSANKIAGTDARILYDHCEITPFRFFFDFFRCTTGDRRITSNDINQVKGLADGVMPVVLALTAREEPDFKAKA